MCTVQLLNYTSHKGMGLVAVISYGDPGVFWES